MISRIFIGAILLGNSYAYGLTPEFRGSQSLYAPGPQESARERVVGISLVRGSHLSRPPGAVALDGFVLLDQVTLSYQAREAGEGSAYLQFSQYRALFGGLGLRVSARSRDRSWEWTFLHASVSLGRGEILDNLENDTAFVHRESRAVTSLRLQGASSVAWFPVPGVAIGFGPCLSRHEVLDGGTRHGFRKQDRTHGPMSLTERQDEPLPPSLALSGGTFLSFQLSLSFPIPI